MPRSNAAEPPQRTYCSLSPPPRRSPAQTRNRCVQVQRACIEAEQVVLHGPNANVSIAALTRLLGNARDPFDAFQRLHPTKRPSVIIGSPGTTYEYLPLAINAKSAEAREAPFRSRHVQPPLSSFSNMSALIFFTTWSAAFQETFTRATVQVMEHWCATPAAWSGLAIFPSFWKPADSRQWLAAFAGKGLVEPLALMPTPPSVQHALFDGTCNATCLAAYRRDSNAFFAARRSPRCFEQADVCDFSAFAAQPGRSRAWSTMQAVGAHLAGEPLAQNLRPHLLNQGCDAGGARVNASGEGRYGNASTPCRLRVLFVIRQGRRRLSNLDELLDACASIQLLPSKRRFGTLKVECTAHSFAGGIEASLPLLRTADVIIGPHGADLINALALHAGASVLEVLPVKRYGCPCLFFKYMFSSEPDKVFHYQAASLNATFASGPFRKTFHGDVALPPSVMRSALGHIVNVGGRPSRYKFRRFEY